MKHIASGRVKLSHDDTLALLGYGSGLVKDAMDNVFVESSFIGARPITGII